MCFASINLCKTNPFSIRFQEQHRPRLYLSIILISNISHIFAIYRVHFRRLCLIAFSWSTNKRTNYALNVLHILRKPNHRKTSDKIGKIWQQICNGKSLNRNKIRLLYIIIQNWISAKQWMAFSFRFHYRYIKKNDLIRIAFIPSDATANCMHKIWYAFVSSSACLAHHPANKWLTCCSFCDDIATTMHVSSLLGFVFFAVISLGWRRY